MASAPGSLADLPPDHNRGPTIAAVAWTFTALSTVFYAFRLYTKLFILRLPQWDDWILLLAVVINITAAALSSVTIQSGLGRHIFYLTEDEIANVLFYSTISQPFGIFAYCIPKLAVVVLIIRLMGPQKKGVYFLYTLIAVLFVLSAISAIFIFVQCDPPSHMWHPLEPGAHCWSPSIWADVSYAGAAWSAFTDLVLAVFPATIFRNLQIKRSRRIRLSIIMGLGALATIAAIIKTTQLHHDTSKDLTWDIFSLDITSCIETQIVIIAACAPTLPRLFEAMTGNKKGGSSAQSGGSGKSAPMGSGTKDSHGFHAPARVKPSPTDSYLELTERGDAWA